ncbi:alpha/beta fold hydrolase [Ferrimonas gelatinilytica]|uniref:Alpha/beta fold hydrolase n=2 Tax=Ferrimonas gelatinilytica TaxID=1255257 RepID=A0ABP9S3Y1_9GAMM
MGILRLERRLLVLLFWMALGGAVTLLSVAVWWLNQKPTLSPWHTLTLTEEFTAHREVDDFDAYLALESALFAEKERKLASALKGTEPVPFNRYFSGSRSDPAQWPQNWNRSFEWANPDAPLAVLLVHGMSDSPYYLSHLARHFTRRAHVLGLRLPGHGTLPSALVDLRWQDLAAAVSLAVAHLKAQDSQRPVLLVGFSTGAALALNHELARLSEDQPVDLCAMVFVSPAIGLSPIAAGAAWQARLGRWLELDKLAWESLSPEYHPFKYSSFPVNAADIVYRLIESNRSMIEQLDEERLATLPPMLSFNSIIDETVDTGALLDSLYLTLAADPDELVLFDVNRTWIDQQLLTQDPFQTYQGFFQRSSLPFRTTLVENRGPGDRRVHAREFPSQQTEELNLSWPERVHSLSHVGLPIAESDPLLGPHQDPEREHVYLGHAAISGEKGMFVIPSSEVLRQKWNPFFSYMTQRIDAFTGHCQAKGEVTGVGEEVAAQ